MSGPAAPPDAAPPGAAPPARRRWPLHLRMLVGLVVGSALGLAVHAWADGDAGRAAQVKRLVDAWVQPLGQVFLNLIFMVVVPLVTSSVMLAVVELGDLRALGRVGLRTLGWTVVCSGAAVALGVGLVAAARPGDGVTAEARTRLLADFGKSEQATKALATAEAVKDKPVLAALVSVIPKNPLEAGVNALTGDMLALMLFSLLFGAALARVRDPTTEPLIGALVALQRASMVIVGWAMALAPLGVAALLFGVAARTGTDVLLTLAAYAAVVLLGLLAQLLVVYGLILRLGAGVSPAEWLRRTGEVLLTAFSTSSSAATLPSSLATAERRLGIPPRIGTFVLTVGATGNQNGTALFEGVTVLFLAQVFGVELSLDAQVKVVLMSILAGVGTAGVPGGSLPLIVLVLQSVGVPAGSIAIILGVDRILDMSRTVVNVAGDLVIATVVAKAEGALAFDAPPSASAA